MLSKYEKSRREAVENFDIKKWRKENPGIVSKANIGTVGHVEHGQTSLTEAIKIVTNK